jgi:hypothetical protein
MMTADLRALKDFADGIKDEIIVNVADPGNNLWIQRQFRTNNAHTKVLAIVLSYQNPKDILTGQCIDTKTALAWQNEKEFHHFFPQAYLKQKGHRPGQINALANIVMLTSASNKMISARSPSEYLAEVEKAAGTHLDEWLKSNLISPNAFAAAKKNDYDAFLMERAASIHTEIKRLAGW